MLSLQMGFSFVRAAVACAILERTSGLEPSSETTAPRYLMLVTVPIFCPVTFITLLMPLVLFVISLVFSALISILYLVQVLSRLSTRASSFSFSSVRASVSSVNRRLVIFLEHQTWSVGGRVAQSVGHLTRKSGVLGSIPGLATYFRFSFRFFKTEAILALFQLLF